MDVATTTKNFVDTGISGKSTGGTAEQLLGDFSAAVAERMKQAGKVTGEHGKTTLTGRLDAKTDTIVEARAQNDAPDTRPHDNYDSIEDAPSAPRQQDNAPPDRAEAPADRAPAHDDVAASDAPRETTHDDAPAEHADDSPQDAPDSEQAASGDTPQDNEAETQTSQSSEAAPAEEAATAQGLAVAVQQVGSGPAADVLAGVASKAAGAKAATGDGSQKQNAAKGQESAQGGQKAAEGGQKAVEGGANQGAAELAQKSDGAKGKSTAAQAQAGQNTHVKAEAQTDGGKGATVAQQQAAELSKKVGSDQAMNVKVNVSKASEDLVSKPTANLAGPTNVKADGESLTPTVAQAAAKGQSAANNSTGQNNADGQAQNQQQAQAQAAQALAANAQAAKAAATAVEGKVAQNVDTTTTAQTAKAGGAEGASTTQAALPSGSTQQSAAAPPPQAKPHQSARAQVTEQVTVQISKAISDGVDKIRIQLKPAHLGRVDVELQIAKDGHVTAVVSADNKDTLDLLKQDQRALERALREAGLNLGSSDLSFSMRGQDGQGTEQKEMAQDNSAPAEPLLEPTLEELLETQSSRRDIISEDRVDITA